MSNKYLLVKNYIKSLPLGRKIRDLYQKRGFNRGNAAKAFRRYYGEDSGLDKEKIIIDMLGEAKRYGFGFDEYHMYHFEKMPLEERRTYVSDKERINYCERMNSYRNMILFDDKGLTYSFFRRYYHRDLVEVFSKREYELFAAFLKKHPKFIVKPFDGACGVGVRILDASGSAPETIFRALRKRYGKGFVVEELIIQHPEMARLHPQSVNTLRIPTIHYGEDVEIIHPFIRIGRGESVVDNGWSGGICCGIDPETGTVFSASDENGEDYTVHPDTGVNLIGYQVPRWEEATALAKELAGVLPDNHYTGWDLALTKDGWVMQEANDRGGFLGFQITSKKGFRPEIEEIVHRLGV